MKTVEEHSTASKPWRRIALISSFVLAVIGILLAGAIVNAKQYDGRVLPGIAIGDVPIGGMNKSELREHLYAMINRLVDAGIRIRVQTPEEVVVVIPSTVVDDSAVDLLYLDVEKEIDNIFAKQEKNIFFKAGLVLFHQFKRTPYTLEYLSFDKENLFDELTSRLSRYETEVTNASVSVASLDPLAYAMTSSSPGVVFDYEGLGEDIVSAWSVLAIPDIAIERSATKPDIVEADVEPILDSVPAVFAGGGFELAYADPHTRREYTWRIDSAMLAKWLEAVRTEDGKIELGVSASSTKAFLKETIAKTIDVSAEDAKFEIGENGKVAAFQGSRPGIALDVDATYKAVNNIILQRSRRDESAAGTLAVVVKQVEPDIKTGEVNELGINEVLGVGYSNYGGSPPNRIKNIRHAVYNKLNGLLIKPDEDFSLLNALKPFTIEGGYLPELVIKGDKIEPEIGGGLCQIGSTVFRAAMNAGMSITERRNHSLVVSYYNDPRNGNPGTDATIYDPAPDFRFKNDTGNYVLLTTEMNERTGDLVFTLWGTSDGRKAYYTEPIVSRWIPTGPAKDVPTTELAPGEKKCQGAHPGAVASFTYIRELPSGEKIERVFESYYRPLPTICLVGTDESDVAKEGARVCDILPNGQESCTVSGEGESAEESSINEQTPEEAIS